MSMVTCPFRCFAPDGAIIEGKGVEPHMHVDLDADDVRTGRDTLLERAIDVALGR